jgi:hypothetical protein
VGKPNKVSILESIRKEGIPLRETPKGGRFQCPFHQDRHPSAFAYRDTNRFFCFGCGERGDAIDFIMKLKGMNFKDARAYLGIGGKDGGERQKRGDDRWKRKRFLLKAFREWEKQYYDKSATIYRAAHKVMKGFKTMEEVEQFADLYHEMPLIEHRMDILLQGSEEEKYQLFKEVQGELRLG